MQLKHCEWKLVLHCLTTYRAVEALWMIVSIALLTTYRAVEALWMIVVIESLHPAVSSLYWESTGHTLGSKQLVPVWKQWHMLQRLGPVHVDINDWRWQTFCFWWQVKNKLCMKSQREQVSFITLTGIQKMNVAYSSLKSIRNMSVKL